eukprot:COSAG05_NODE_225_length_13597_cov_18.878723_7_plen_103_part_00
MVAGKLVSLYAIQSITSTTKRTKVLLSHTMQASVWREQMRRVLAVRMPALVHLPLLLRLHLLLLRVVMMDVCRRARVLGFAVLCGPLVFAVDLLCDHPQPTP